MRTLQGFTVVAAAGLALVATAAWGSPAELGVSARPAPATAEAVPSRLAQARRAVRTAERAVQGGRAYDIESDLLRGVRVWEVKVAQGAVRPHEIDVSADGRRILRRQRRARVDLDARRVAQAKVTLGSALTIAGARARTGTFDEAEIEREHGRLVWEVVFEHSGGREVEIKVDALTGKVVSVEND